MKRKAGVVATVASTLLLTGCGVPAENSPRLLPSIGGAHAPAAAPTTMASHGAPIEALYFVRDGKLVSVSRALPNPPTTGEQLTDLLAGPTETERDTGLTSALTGTEFTATVQVQDGVATVEIGNRRDGTGRSDEVLAFGQIVCTLTARADVDSVAFRYDGHHLNVPRSDGSLAEGALVAADYASLVTPA